MNTAQMRKQIIQYIDQLSPESLQFVTEFLAYLSEKEYQKVNQNNYDHNTEQNALELAGDLVGSIEASPDLSTNKDYFQSFGK
jgi:hypothetical protein